LQIVCTKHFPCLTSLLSPTFSLPCLPLSTLPCPTHINLDLLPLSLHYILLTLPPLFLPYFTLPTQTLTCFLSLYHVSSLPCIFLALPPLFLPYIIPTQPPFLYSALPCPHKLCPCFSSPLHTHTNTHIFAPTSLLLSTHTHKHTSLCSYFSPLLHAHTRIEAHNWKKKGTTFWLLRVSTKCGVVMGLHQMLLIHFMLQKLDACDATTHQTTTFL
jgi:hypothetical protein